MIKWLKRVLRLNGFSRGGFTGLGHWSAMAGSHDGQEIIMPESVIYPWNLSDAGFKTEGHVSAPPSDDGLELSVPSPRTKDAS